MFHKKKKKKKKKVQQKPQGQNQLLCNRKERGLHEVNKGEGSKNQPFSIVYVKFPG